MTKDNETTEKENNKKSHCAKFWLYYLFILFEAIIISLYGFLTDFSTIINPKNFKIYQNSAREEIINLFPFFQSVHLTIFIGFGFSMTFLKKYSWSGVAKNFLLAAWTIQLSIITNTLWGIILKGKWEFPIELNLEIFIKADLTAASILIAFGAVLGKLHFTQYLLIATIQTIIYGLQMNLLNLIFSANDLGGSIKTHMFGAFFGFAVTLMTKRKDAEDNPNFISTYYSNLLSMIGTLVLWICWPSCVASLATGMAQYRAILNTLISILGSCVIVFFMTPFFNDGKFQIERILSATLTGGVIIGSSADLIIQPWMSFLIGCFGGIASLLSFEYLGPFLKSKIGLQDTCGVFSLHGITGFLGGLVSVIIIWTATFENYGDSFYELFPTMTRKTSSVQAMLQFAGIGSSLFIALFGGIFTGWIVNSKNFEKINFIYDDKERWVFEEDEDYQKLKHKNTGEFNLEMLKRYETEMAICNVENVFITVPTE